MSSKPQKSSLQAALMVRPAETTEIAIKKEFIEDAKLDRSTIANHNPSEIVIVDSEDEEDSYQETSKRHKTTDEMDVDDTRDTCSGNQEDENMSPAFSPTNNETGQDQAHDLTTPGNNQASTQFQTAKALVGAFNDQQVVEKPATHTKAKASNPYAKEKKHNLGNQDTVNCAINNSVSNQCSSKDNNLNADNTETTTKTSFKDKYSPEMRAKAAKFLANQEATSRGHVKQVIHSVLMCVMLHKQKNVLDITQNRNHVKQLRELLEMMRKADASTCLIPVDDNADNQDPLTAIPQDVATIWKKELQPYISARNCQFGNRYTQSLRLRFSTANYVDPYSMGKWITENWAIKNNANVFHDRIQEGIKVQAACFTNVADTMNYRDLQGDLERCVNNELLSLCQKK